MCVCSNSIVLLSFISTLTLGLDLELITLVTFVCAFQGQAFTSKPTEVVFQDFDVGKTYRKKVVLTNISYSFNYCKLLGVTDNLKDFVTIEFNPPGSMSAGLTCHMLVSFQPKVFQWLLNVLA